MKKVFTLAVSLFVISMVAFAQEEQGSTFQFVDARGAVVEDGSSMTVTDYIDMMGDIQMAPALYIKNASDERAYCTLSCDVQEMSNGSFSNCMFGQCVSSSSNIVESVQWVSEGGEKESVANAHWLPAAYGTAKVVYQIKVYEYTMGGGYSHIGNGPSVTVNFVYNENSTGIDDVTVATGTAEEVARYGIDGSRLSQPTKGINLVKYSDGSTRKVLVK